MLITIIKTYNNHMKSTWCYHLGRPYIALNLYSLCYGAEWGEYQLSDQLSLEGLTQY